MVHPMLDVFALAREKVVEDNDFVSFHHEFVYQVTSHEARSARDEDFLALGIGEDGCFHDMGIGGCGDGLGGD
jgi:hypothetical protein